jgi:hypothetical protein
MSQFQIRKSLYNGGDFIKRTLGQKWFMHHKNMKLIIRKQFERQYPNWKQKKMRLV